MGSLTEADIGDIVETLRRLGGDDAAIEVKSAAGGLPDSISSTICAFANEPGGGRIILGLDERDGFRAVTLADPSVLQAGLAAKARQAVHPAVQLTTEIVRFEGADLVVAQVDELPSSHKPCRVGGPLGPAFLRAHDGDYQLSDLEIQALTVARSQPFFDREPVSEAARDDLDPELVRTYIQTARDTDRRLAAVDHDDDLLHRTAVLIDGRPTLAGLLALGGFPQQFFPSLVLQVVIPPIAGDPIEVRFRASQRFTGAIPYLLDDAVRWIALNSSRATIAGSDGHLRDVPAWPPEATRELLANALVHRDLGPWARSQAVTARLEPDRLTVTNPGGLYGLTVDRLNPDNVESFARNSALVQICQYARLPDGRRVIEGLATGIPKVFQLAIGSGLERPRFFDHAVRFTAQLRSTPAPMAPAAAVREHLTSEPLVDAVMNFLAGHQSTARELSAQLGVPLQTIRNALRTLTASGQILRDGGRGVKTTTYRLAEPRQESS